MTTHEEGTVVSPNGFCRFFDRCDTSLIEEPETCDVCSWYREGDSRCLRKPGSEGSERSN